MSSKAWTYLRRCRKMMMIEELGRVSFVHPSTHSLASSFLRHSLDVATLDNRRKSIPQLVHHNLGQIIACDTRNIAIAYTVLGDNHVVAQSCSVPCSSGYADVCLRFAVSHPKQHSAFESLGLTIYPVKTTFAPDSSPRNSCKSVSANALG